MSTPMTPLLPPEFSETEILASLPPDTENHSSASAEVKALLHARRNGLLHLISRELWQSATRGYRGRRNHDVSQFYEETYDENAWLAVANHDYSLDRHNVYRIGSNLVVRARSSEISRLWTYRLGDIIGALGQDTVCEIGSGNGRNLLYLANRFASTKFRGFELSSTGTKVAQQLQCLDLPGTNYGKHYGMTPQGMDNVRRIEFKQASAFDLPCADKSNNIVYTFAALEQMGDGLDQALDEIRRVTGRYALFFEPFYDCNDHLGRTYLWSRNYFRLQTGGLRKYGFEHIRTWRVVPVKPTFAYAFALYKPV